MRYFVFILTLVYQCLTSTAGAKKPTHQKRIELAQVNSSKNPFGFRNFATISSASPGERRKHRLLNHHHSKRRHRETSVRHLIESGDDIGLEDTTSFLGGNDVEKVIVRPGAGTDEPEVVRFGLFLKNFYGSDLKSNTFRGDIVTSLRWNDSRVIKWIPEGLEKLVLSDSQAIHKMWIPDMVITNHELGGVQIVSTSVEVSKTGEVSKVERAQVRACNLFKLQDYPFDEQNLKIKIASAKYMASDLVLKPMVSQHSTGVNKDEFGGSYDLHGYSTSVGEEVDGDLVKSRGILEIKVARNLDKYKQDHLLPTSIVLMISWGVFYFPFENPFVTPRLVLSIIALLTFTNLMVKSASLLPGAAPFNWNDLFNQLVQFLMFVVIVINIFSEICFHHFGVESLARKVNHEAKVLLPVLSVLCISLIMCSGYYKLMSLHVCTIISQLLVILCLGGYVYYTMKRFRQEPENPAKRRASTPVVPAART